MKKNRIDFEIIPIFNQSASPRTWHDFTEIEMKCDSEKYNYHVDETDRRRIFQSHMYDWNHCKYNMAFAAYYDGAMIGFSTAYKENSNIYLRNLYVAPQYEGLGIGKALLEKTEKAANLISNNIEVVSLAGALGFYQSRGYISLNDRVMNKKLPESFVGVVPVFQWYKTLRAKIKVDVDYSLLVRNRNQPIFIYVSTNREM